MLDRTFLSSPTRLSPTQFKIGTGVTTPDVTDTDLETPVNINGSDFKNFVSGFPTLDILNMIATIRCFVATTEANGNSLTEFGVVNEDGSPLLFSHAVHSALIKTDSIQATYIEKNQIL